MRSSWVIYVCRGCGEAVANGRAAHAGGCWEATFDEVRVVRAPATAEEKAAALDALSQASQDDPGGYR